MIIIIRKEREYPTAPTCVLVSHPLKSEGRSGLRSFMELYLQIRPRAPFRIWLQENSRNEATREGDDNGCNSSKIGHHVFSDGLPGRTN